MKKLLALILAITLMASMSVTAFAANTTGGSTEVSFNVDPTYTVTIPAKVELQKIDTDGAITYENDYTITAEAGVRLKKGETIVITVASDYVMETPQGATLPYTITQGTNTITAENNKVATFTTSTSEQKSTIHISANDPEFAGEYKDTVTFTISVVAPTIISFTIDEPQLGNKTFQADVGMTWGEWVASSYNTDGYTVVHYGEGDVIAGPKGSFIVLVGEFVFQSPEDVIVANQAYEVPNF